MSTTSPSCINCDSRREVLIVQASARTREGTFEEVHRLPICRECLTDPVTALTLATTIRNAR